MTTDAPWPRWLELVALAAILLVAAFFRFHDLETIPPGLTHDEADVGFYAAAFARGEWADFDAPYGYAYEPYGRISSGLLMKALGPTDYALRAHQALYGLLVVGLTYAWARTAFGRFVALSAAALAATLFWTVFTSRMALNSQPTPAVFLLAVIALWRALYEGNPRVIRRGGSKTRPYRKIIWWLVFALAVAAMLHIYEAARAAWFAFPAFMVYLLLADRARLRRHGRAFALALGAGTALALPHLLDPGAWGRTGALGGAVRALLNGDPGPLVKNAVEGLGTLAVSGDTLLTYNLPGRPVLWPALALFFCVGLIVCLARVRRPAQAFTLLWLGFGLVPTLVIGAYTSTLHSIVAQPVVCILPAAGAAWLVQEFFTSPQTSLHRWRGTFKSRISPSPFTKRGAGGEVVNFPLPILTAIWILALLLTGAITARDYFTTWGQSAEVRAAYFHTLAAITARLDADPQGGVAGISSPFPEPPLDPFIGALRVHNEAIDVRWMDARLAVTLPPVEEARLFASADAPLDPLLARLLEAEHIERVPMRADDLTPYYEVYRLRPNAARARLANLRADAVFGGAAALVGCRIDPAQPAPGGLVDVLTLWAVRDPAALGPVPAAQYAHELAITVQALDATGALISQHDALGAPASDWRAGDAFLHLHRVALPDPLPAGAIRFIVGVYRRADVARLPLAVDGAPAGDALTLDCPGL